MNVFVTASNGYYQNVRDYLVKSVKKCGGFDKVVFYDVDTMIDDSFRRAHSEILNEKRGAGLWLWKVYFIEKAIREECQDGDLLFYCDAASYFFRDARPLLSSINSDIFAINVPYMEEEYTKKETFALMGLNEEKYRRTRQFHASFMAFRKTTFTENFIEEWFSCCQNIDIIGDVSDVLSQNKNFIDHRFDQSIFSLLCKKYNVIASPDPSQWGIDPYPPRENASYLPIERGFVPKGYFCIILHKGRQISFCRRMMIWIVIFKHICIRMLYNNKI